MPNLNLNKEPNKLINERSPYLREHAHNPVNWYPWGREAFERAKAEDKPIFLSIGYSTCHWCHVMNRESFEDNAIAEILNGNFVAVKLDREERPDIDGLYMDACTAISGHGGWPLTAFLNHDKSPFFAGTYYPKAQLTALLNNVAALWQDDREKLRRAGGELMRFLSGPIAGKGGPRHTLLKRGVYELRRSFDPAWGGFLPAPKFPSLQRLLFLLRHRETATDSGVDEMIVKTLQGMHRGGIFDHIGGGFFRYSTDSQWHIPHYEKMLYDNALSILTYGEAAAALGAPAFGAVAQRCYDFIMRELKCETGGFYTALDAESPGGEGAFYLWTADEIADVLGERDGRIFCAHYGIEKTNFLPNRVGKDGEAGDSASLEKLYLHREKRQRPHRDEKILAAGNALTAAALASAGKLLGKPAWIREAEKTADFILDRLCCNGRLKCSYFEGRANHKSTLDDYAYFVWALIELYESTFHPKWLGLALNWNAHMLELFRDAGGGLFLSGRDVTDLPARQKVYLDGPLPSGNAVAAMNLTRLSTLCGEASYLEIADGILAAGAGAADRYPAASAGLLTAILLDGNIQALTITAGTGREALVQAAVGYHPFLQVVCGSGERPDTVSRVAPSTADCAPIDGRAAAYLCDRSGCRRPVTQDRQLADMLGRH